MTDPVPPLVAGDADRSGAWVRFTTVDGRKFSVDATCLSRIEGMPEVPGVEPRCEVYGLGIGHVEVRGDVDTLTTLVWQAQRVARGSR